MQLLKVPVTDDTIYWETLEPYLAEEFTFVKMPNDGMCGWGSVLYNVGRVEPISVKGRLKWTSEDWNSLKEFVSRARDLIKDAILGIEVTHNVRMHRLQWFSP